MIAKSELDNKKFELCKDFVKKFRKVTLYRFDEVTSCYIFVKISHM